MQVCNYDPKNTIQIYNITNNLTKISNTSPQILYTELGNDDKLIETLQQKIKQDCNTKNILIRCSSKHFPIADKINQFLNWINQQKIQTKNLSIYHETKDMKDIIYNISTVKKNINIFSSEEAIITRAEYSFSFPSKYIPGKTYEGTVNGQQFLYQTRSTKNENDSNKLEDQWWAKVYLSIPPCATGRFVQFTGTCWFNSVLNMLVLTPKIANLLKTKWMALDIAVKKELEGITFETCPLKTYPLNKMLFVVINNLLIKGIKAKTNVDFISGIAKEAKTQYKTIYKVKDIETKNDDGGTNTYAIRLILETLCTPIKEFNIFDIDNTSDYKNKKINTLNTEDDAYFAKYKDKENKWNAMVSEYNRLLNMKKSDINKYNAFIPEYNASDRSSEKTSKLNKLKENMGTSTQIFDQYKIGYEKSKKIFENDEKELDLYRISYEKNKQLVEDKVAKLKSFDKIINSGNNFAIGKDMADLFVYPMKDTDGPLIIIVQGSTINLFLKAPIQLTYGANTYELSAANVTPYKGHTIAGLICNNKKYLYDSNNAIAYDDWSNGKIDNYAPILLEKFRIVADYKGLNNLVYVRKDYMIQGGSDPYFEKYKKYKTKYLKLKNSI